MEIDINNPAVKSTKLKYVKKASITESFKKSFPGLVPIKTYVEDKVVSPDRELTIASLSKRFEKIFTTGISNEEYNFDGSLWGLRGSPSWHYRLWVPFITYRGSVNYKFMKTTFPSASTTAGVTTFTLPKSNRLTIYWASLPGDKLDPTLNGLIVNDNTVNPWTEVSLPAYDLVPCRETDPCLPNMPVTRSIHVFTDSADSETYDIYGSVGDDFSLGPFVGIPPCVFTPPAAAPSSWANTSLAGPTTAMVGNKKFVK